MWGGWRIESKRRRRQNEEVNFNDGKIQSLRTGRRFLAVRLSCRRLPSLPYGSRAAGQGRDFRRRLLAEPVLRSPPLSYFLFARRCASLRIRAQDSERKRRRIDRTKTCRQHRGEES